MKVILSVPFYANHTFALTKIASTYKEKQTAQRNKRQIHHVGFSQKQLLLN